MPVLSPDMNLREVIARWPQTRPALDAAGLLGCGGAQGPDETIEFFARVHHVPLVALMDDLRRAIASAPPRVERPAAQPPVEDARRFVPFLLASIALTLTFGATLGMVNLARLTTPHFGALSQSSVRAHAFVQVFGFVGLFVMGVAVHVLPRFAGRPLALARLVPVVFALQVAGVVVTSAAFGVADEPLRWIGLAGSAALLGAGALFAAMIARTTLGARTPEPFQRWIVAGACWQVVAAGVAALAAWLDVSWLAALWVAALWGFATSWIFGVGRRIFPAFLAWRTRGPRAEMPAFILYQAAVAASVAAAAPIAGRAAHPLTIAGAAALIVAVPLYSWCLGAAGRRGPAPVGESGYRRYISAAWAWLGVAVLIGPLLVLVAALRDRDVPPLATDFARHALAFGFVTQVMMGVASRILPVFTGHALWSPRARTLAFALLNLSIGIRAIEAVVAAGFLPAAWPLIAWSGPPAVAAVLLFALNVTLTIHGRPARAPASRGARTLADTLVSEVLEQPGALDVLVAAGFTPLRNPVLRAAFAGSVTLRQACALKQIPLEETVKQLARLQPPRPIIALKPVK